MATVEAMVEFFGSGRACLIVGPLPDLPTLQPGSIMVMVSKLAPRLVRRIPLEITGIYLKPYANSNRVPVYEYVGTLCAGKIKVTGTMRMKAWRGAYGTIRILAVR